jgi:hypothetical protein
MTKAHNILLDNFLDYIVYFCWFLLYAGLVVLFSPRINFVTFSIFGNFEHFQANTNKNTNRPSAIDEAIYCKSSMNSDELKMKMKNFISVSNWPPAFREALEPTLDSFSISWICEKQNVAAFFFQWIQ